MWVCIQDINHKELERSGSERQRDFLEMLKGFVHNQVSLVASVCLHGLQFER